MSVKSVRVTYALCTYSSLVTAALVMVLILRREQTGPPDTQTHHGHGMAVPEKVGFLQASETSAPQAGRNASAQAEGTKPVIKSEPKAREPSVRTRALSVQYMGAFAARLNGPFLAQQRGKWSAEQLKEFTELLGKRMSGKSDAQELAAKNGVNPASLLDEIDTTTFAQMKEKFGDETVNQFKAYEATAGPRYELEELNKALAYEGVPLIGEQIDALATFMKATQLAKLPIRGTPEAIDDFMRTRGAESEAIYRQAQGLLNATQLAALKDRFDREMVYYCLCRSHAQDRVEAGQQ